MKSLLLLVFSFLKLSLCANINWNQIKDFNDFEAFLKSNHFEMPNTETPALLEELTEKANLPTSTASLMDLPTVLIDLSLDWAILKTIPLIMFTCKAILNVCIKKRLFQKYLAWKYQTPGLTKFLHLFFIEGKNYFKDTLEINRQYDSFKLEELVLKCEGVNDRVVDHVLLASFETGTRPNSGIYCDSFANSGRTATLICLNYDLQVWIKARNDYDCLKSVCISRLPRLSEIFSHWFKRDRTLFNRTFLRYGVQSSYSWKWNSESVMAFLLAEGTEIDPSLDAFDLAWFFWALSDALLYEKEADALKLNAANAGAKIMNYLRASSYFQSILFIQLRFDPEFVFDIDSITVAESVRNIAVILRNAGKHEQAAPLFELLKDKRALVAKYNVRSEHFERFGLFNVNRFELLFPDGDDSLKYPSHVVSVRKDARKYVMWYLMTPEEFEQLGLDITLRLFYSQC